MKRKISIMFVLVLVAGLTLPTVVAATEAGTDVSGNHVVTESPAEQPVTEDAAPENPANEPAADLAEEEPAAEQPKTEEPAVPAGGEAPQEEEMLSDVVEEKKVSGGGALAIDGYYDDWEGVPETKITYGSHNASGTIYEYHGGAILVSGDYVYVHIRMNDLYKSQIPVDELKLTIGGAERSFIIRKRNADNTINWSSEVYALSQGIHTDLGVYFRDGGYMALGEAAVTISEASPNDSFEFRMKISDLEALYGLEPGTIENGAKLEFYSPNIGPEKVTVVGSSTGTYIGILLCFAVVLSALIGQKRKQAHS